MKFKVWDKVRLTREAIEESVRRNWCVNYSAVIGWEVIRSDEDQSFISTAWQGYPLLNQDLELVPEEPEFEEGEMIEVSDDWKEWERRIFLYYIPNVPDKYLCVHKNYEGVYLQGWDRYYYQVWLYARKLKSQLTRKEIAEKFWVSEDFTLVD